MELQRDARIANVALAERIGFRLRPVYAGSSGLKRRELSAAILPDHQEGLAAFRERRKPNFTGR